MLTRCVCVFILLGFGLLQAQSAWVVDSLQRVGMTDAAGATTSIALYAAKGEAESFQAVVHAPSSGLTITNLTASDLMGPSGATISQQNFTFYREYYVNVATISGPNLGGTNLSMGPGWYPDPLIPFKDPATGKALSGTYDALPYALAGNHNQPYWIDVNVPRTAVAGQYTGTVTVTTSLGTFTMPITLQVWNFTLPTAPRLKASFGFGGDTTLAENQVLLQHRLNPFIVVADQVSSLKPYGAAITGLSFFNLSSGCTVESLPSLSTVAAAVAQYAGFATYLYPMDEVNGCPNLEHNLQKWAQVAHAAGTKTLVTVVPQASLLDDGTGSGRTDVDIWTILPKQYAAALPELPAIFAKGNELWSYTALVQENYSPKWEIDFAPINFRISPGFINQQFGFTGMLYSRVNRWTSNPWNNVNTFQIPPYNYAGEQMLVYPGQYVGMSAGTIVPSLRLKFLRDGFDDYDYIALLKDQGESAFADSIVNSIAPDWTNWTKSTATLLNARIQLGNELDRLGGGSTQQVAAPTFSVAGGTYSTAQTVAISTSTTGDSIRYTTDGSTPSSTVGTVYSSPITVSSSLTVKAIGYMSGWTSSAVSSAAYTITGTVAVPAFSVADGTYATTQMVAISSSTIGSSTRYTTDGSTPSSTVGTLYSTPITVSSSMTVKAIGYMSGWNTSAVNSAAYTITGTVAVPTFSVADGTYTSVPMVAISSTTIGSSIRYTTDGSTPSSTVGTLYSAPIPVSSSMTVKAIGYMSNWTNSAVSSATYTITGTVGTPTFSLTGGNYTAAQIVAISSNTPGSSIRYTTDGSAPSPTAGALYSGPITVSSSMTIIAIAYKSGWINSAVSSSSYVINQPSLQRPLQAPSTPWPTVGATAVATSLTLQCNAVTGATQYQIYFGTGSTLSLLATVPATGNVVRQPVLNLAIATTYYWKVVAISGAFSTSSPIWSFTTDSPSTLQAPSNPWPAVGSAGNTTNLTLQVNAVTGATQYQIYLGTDSTALPLIKTTTATGNVVRQAVYHLSAGTTYYWKVIAISGSTSVSGPVWSFKTN